LELNQNISISAFIPCYNHWHSIDRTVKSIQEQSFKVKEILIIDDGSRDFSPNQNLLNDSKVKIIRLKKNHGRGYCRNLALKKSTGELILNLDATNYIEKNFIKKAIPYFSNPEIAAISGTLNSRSKENTLDRWRSRHLFREQSLNSASEAPCSMLISYGTILKRKIIRKVGGFNTDLKFNEDKELGDRLAKNGYKVIGLLDLKIYPCKSNTLLEVLERYSRWYMDTKEKPSFTAYLHNIKASFRPMIQSDLDDGDWSAVLISLLVPHAQLYFSCKTFVERNWSSRHKKNLYT
jgi:glycosyltransferase involved in cell wall biosynthesis